MAINAGDIAFVGVNATDPDQFAVLALNTIAAGDTFYVTDGGYTGATTGAASAYFRTSEGFLQYTAPTGGIAAGTVILITGGGGSSPSVSLNGGGTAGTVTLLGNSSSVTTNFTFSTSGDSLTAYTVTGGTHLTGTPTLIAFISFGVTPYGSGSAQSSSIPTIAGGQVLNVGNLDNAIFTNAANVASQTITALSTPSNFSARDLTRYDLTTLTSASATPTVNLSVSSTTGSEAGQTVITVTATASSAVSGNQTVNLAVTGTGITTGDYTLSNTTITIPSGSTTGSVTFTVVDDALVEGTETAFLTISNPSSGITLGSTTTQNITIADNDNPGVIITESGGSTNVTEGGATDGYTVALATQPTGSVTVTINAGTQVATNSSTLTFTSTNWNQAQTVTVTAVDDTVVEGNHTGTITHSVSSADSNYNGITVAGVTVNITDNDVAITKISAIQGSGLAAALTGVQTIEGIVTRVFAGSTKLNGFYVQEEDADSDGNAATSEAIFVYDPSGLFTGNVGDKVRVTGTAKELTTTSGGNTSSLTELDTLTSVINLGASTLPTAVNVQLPVTSASNLERYEGMLVNISAATGNLTVTENYQLGRYGQVVLAADGASNQAGTDARLDQYTQFNAPNVSGYAAYQAELAKRKIYLDDGSSTQNLDPILFGRGGNPLSATNTLRSGDTVASITGILDERFEGYRIQTTAPVNFIASNPRPVTPPVVGGTLKVASFNVLNYFNDLDTNPGSNNGPNITTPNGLTFEPRGANTSTEFTRQRDKIIQVIVTSGADVMGLMELENNGFGSTSAIQDLVNGLNAVAGAGTYTFINPGTSISTDAITVGIIYKPSKVTPVGAAATMPNDYGSGAFDLVGRKPLAQTFAQSSNGATFTVVVNHFKSKSSSAGAIGDADAGDGQGLSNGTRTRQAQDLATWLATKPTGVNDADYLLLGDFNAYSKEDPITTLASNGYSNLLPNTSYSYVFDGQVGSLDHALATSTLASQVIGADKWHINADEPAVLDYNTDFKSTNQVTSLYNSDPYRASDHDPVVVGLNLGVNLTGVDLSNYVRIGRYNLPEPSRDTAPTGSVLAQETSAVTYNWDTDTLFVVGDGNTSIVQVSKTGQLIDSMTLTPASAQDSTTGFYDTEGLTYIGGGKFVLIEERDRRANLFTYVPNTTLTRDNVQTVKLGATLTTPDSGNVGIEGISYDPITGGYIAVKEISPSGIFQTGIDFAAGTATNGSATTVNSTNLFDPALAGLGDFSDVYALSNQPTLNGQSQYNNLLILSQESGKIVNSDRSGNISSSLTIVSDPNNPLSVPNQQFEGLTMDRNGLLYVTSENGGGDINHPQVWIYAPSSYNYTNQAPLSVSFNVINSSLVENTNTTNRVKLANIIISDDAKGTNNLTLAGADASAFEINSSTSVPELFLKAGTSLNSTTKGSYNVTVNVDDPTVGSVVDATRNFTLSVTPAPTLVISEVAPWSSGNSAVAADWFEVTNVSANAINITGWKMDDNSNSFASAVSLSGITSIAAGESVIFIESTTASPAATVIQNFKNTWFGGNTPTNLQIGTYQGSGVGLGSGGDAVNLYDGSGNLKANVTFGSSPGASPFATFDNSAGASSVSTLSVAGVKGAYSVTDTTSTQIGSPGKTANYQLQLLHYYGESGLLSVQTAPIMGALIDKFDDQYTNTLILGEGDSYIPGPWLVGGADPSLNGVPGIGSTALGRPDIAIMNAFGTNASALGNHEFDLGSPVLQSAIQASGTWVGAQFPLITANLDFSADSSLRSLADKTLGGTSTNNFAGQEASSIKGKIAPYAVVTKSGEKIGLVGATTYDLLSKSSPNGTVPKDDNNPSTSDLQEVAAYIQGSVDALKAMGINKIIMVDQLDTLDRNKALAPLVSGIDVMVAGGGHERMGDATDIAVGFNGHTADFISDAYPIVTAGADGKPTLIVTTDTEYTYLGRLVVDFDGNGNIVVPNLNPAINGAYASTVATLQTAYNTTNSASQIIASSTIGSQVQAITTAINNVVSSKDGTVWGYTNVYLEGDRAFGRVQEVNLGDITADANLYAARQALGNGVFLTSLKNGGGLRASIGSIDENGNKIAPIANPAASKAAGAISTLDIENALRFDNKLMVFDTTPQGLKNILEFAAGLSSNLSQQSGGYMQIGGIRVSYDPSSASGSKVKSIALTNAAGNVIQAIYGNGSFFASAPSTISMVCLNFTANGGDSYPIKANATNFRYLLTDGTLSAPINSSLDFTAAANVPVNALGEQKSFQTYLQAFHSTPTTAYNVADTGAAQDQRIQILSLRSDTVLQVPTDIGLSSTTIAENSSNGTVLGTLTATDSGGADTTNFIFSLNSNAGGRFAINGSQLVVANGSLLDYETNTSHQVSIRVTDASGAFYDKNFTIGVLDRAVFTINDVTVGEAAGTANFTVTTIDPIATGTATVNYATANGTAFASPYDYIATSGTLTFTGGGATTQTIAVTINNDSIYEPVNETFSVNLSNAINGTIADAQGICTIQDDDLPVTVRVTDASIPEGNSGTKNLNFLISLSAPSGQVVTVDYATANNTATAGSDYTSTSGSLTIQPGATSGVVSVPILGDTTAELDETFFLNLTNATGGVTIARGQAIGTIINDDGVGGLVLTGTSGPDTLTGSTTNDTLTGLAGADILDGQGGADTFVYTALTDSLLGGRDSLRSFNPGEGDRIKLPIVPTAVFYGGSVAASISAPAVSSAYAAAGAGGLAARGAVFFATGSGRTQRLYLSVNDGTAAFDPNSDLVMEVTGMVGAPSVVGALTAANYFI